MTNVFSPDASTMYAVAYLEILLKRQVGMANYTAGKYTASDLRSVLERYNGEDTKAQYAQGILDCAGYMRDGNIQAALGAIGKY